MDGSSVDFIILPLIMIPLLALWLGGIYFADSHPVWKNGSSDVQPAYGPQEIAAAPEPLAVPRPRTAVVVNVPAQAKAVSATAVIAAADTAGAGDPAGAPVAER
jgi:hypothetical protein